MRKRESKETKDSENEIPEMNLDTKYSNNKIPVPENTEKLRKDMDKTKKEIDKLKNFIIKKYPFTKFLSILPPQAIKLFIDEEEVPKETEKFIQLYMVVPEEKFKEIPKIKKAVVEQIEKIQKDLKYPKGHEQKIWIQIKTPVDLWETCLDSKFELFGAIAMSFPLY
ncbi:MAG: hypothetical protein ABIH28_00380, partial [archaeon]